jgi:hypothetical protein
LPSEPYGIDREARAREAEAIENWVRQMLFELPDDDVCGAHVDLEPHKRCAREAGEGFWRS